MLKKLIIFVIVVLTITGCDNNEEKRQIEDSEFYNHKDIEEAIDVVQNNFKKECQGCTLKEISFDEDATFFEGEEWAEEYDADEAIIITTNFDKDSTTYDDYEWILVRSNKGKWQLKKWGYDN